MSDHYYRRRNVIDLSGGESMPETLGGLIGRIVMGLAIACVALSLILTTVGSNLTQRDPALERAERQEVMRETLERVAFEEQVRNAGR
jgi:hypothetical protein